MAVFVPFEEIPRLGSEPRTTAHNREYGIAVPVDDHRFSVEFQSF
jgi:hypothetical protein